MAAILSEHNGEPILRECPICRCEFEGLLSDIIFDDVWCPGCEMDAADFEDEMNHEQD